MQKIVASTSSKKKENHAGKVVKYGKVSSIEHHRAYQKNMSSFSTHLARPKTLQKQDGGVEQLKAVAVKLQFWLMVW